jgi:hypothetical protein
LGSWNFQNICFLHISNNITDVTANYITELDVDGLYYEYSRFVTGYYSGENITSNLSEYFRPFRRHSNANILSDLVSVTLLSRFSSLPYRQCIGEGTSTSPIIVGDLIDGLGVARALLFAAVAGSIIGSLIVVGLICVGFII